MLTPVILKTALVIFFVSVPLAVLAAPHTPPSPADPVTAAIESYSRVTSYAVTMRSTGKGGSEIIRYYYRKPGHVRMEFIRPHKGAVLVYDPEKRVVRLRPLGFTKRIVLTLKPNNRLLRSRSGHTVDESDIGVLLKHVRALQKHGHTEVDGEGMLGRRKAVFVRVESEHGGDAVGVVRRFDLWLDTTSFLPLKVKSFDIGGVLVEEVLMDDIELNVELGDGFFSIECR